MIVLLKGLGAGAFSLALAGLVGQALPPLMLIVETLVVGFLSYGLSTVQFVRSLRGLGAARTSAIYGIAPFAGAGLSLLAFQERVGTTFLIGLPLMLAAVFLLVGERHSHYHVHPPASHEHRVDRDEHHLSGENGDPQSLRHDHVELGHAHPHAPDIHHRHEHESGPNERPQGNS